MLRPNVGIVIRNDSGQVLWAKRRDKDAWQFPQGGINKGEQPIEAMYRELYEEVGLEKAQVKVLAVSKDWHEYYLDKPQEKDSGEVFLGQRQKWFLLQLLVGEQSIDLDVGGAEEFTDWCWVAPSLAVKEIVSFKKKVYLHVIDEFGPYLQGG